MRHGSTYDQREAIRVNDPVKQIVREDRIKCTRICFATLVFMAKPSVVTGTTLGGLTVLHTAWGLGFSFPFHDRGELADAVIGRSTVPSSRACFTVASLLAVGAALVFNLVPLPKRCRDVALATMAAVLALRSAAGFSAKTSLLSKGSDSERFRRLDRQLYSPLCLLLAIGSFRARE
jgi:hypothetical protein